MRTETREQRTERLTAQAAAMRARQAELRSLNGNRRTKHVCPETGTLDIQYKKLLAVLDRIAPANIASIPIAAMLEDGQWSVDVHVRIKGVTEYEITGTGEPLSDAITNAQRQLAHRSYNERKAKRDSQAYGLAY